MFIYSIINIVNSKKYIGQTIGKPRRRWTTHRNNLRNNKHANKHLQYAWNKYGEENFIFNIIDSPLSESIQSLNMLEQRHILLAGEVYNLTEGGKNAKLNAEVRAKLSAKRKGRSLTEEHKRKISEAAMGHKRNLGRPRSEEFKLHMAEKSRGKRHSDEVKAKIGAASRARKTSSETRLKMSIASTGKYHTEESKKKMSEVQKAWRARKKEESQNVS